MKYISSMKNKYLLIVIVAVATACGQGGSDVAAKKKELEAARAEYQTLKEKIDKLEKEVTELDPEFAAQNNKAILVSTFTPEPQLFVHKTEVRGSVESRKNVLLSAVTGGEIKQVHVREGQRVSQGQTLVSLDAEIIRNSIAELKTSLELATAVYDKQANLWEKKIGTEVQYLQAKNNKESLERRLATAYSQLDQSIIKAPFAGTVDELPAKVGEMAAPGVPLVRVVSPQDMYIKADVSEKFIGKFVAGDKVDVIFPAQNKELQSAVASVSQVINSENRTFEIEVRLPATNFPVKPNQVAILKLVDYKSENALVVPTRIIQSDNAGHYVYVVEKKEGINHAKKVHVKPGQSYESQTEIVEGLSGSEQVVDKGVRDLTDDAEVSIAGLASAKEVAKN